MNLHEHKEEFEELIAIVADYIGVPADAVRRDYYIVQMMQNLQNSEYAEVCVFKGGTSLSKCYPGSINRFSEDIDLTFIPVEDMTNKKYSKALKRVEDTISAGFLIEKIETERNDRNKSAFVWPENESKETCRVKLEIGSSVRPDPFSKRSMKTYIQEYLEEKGMQDVVTEFDLQEVKVNTLDITRTFLDKVMSVKRHAICGTLPRKVRHIYDVTVLLDRSDIQDFLNDTERLKQLLKLTKETDSFYLQKRNISEDYDPLGHMPLKTGNSISTMKFVEDMKLFMKICSTHPIGRALKKQFRHLNLSVTCLLPLDCEINFTSVWQHLLVRTIQYHQIIHSGQLLLFRKRLLAMFLLSITLSNIFR